MANQPIRLTYLWTDQETMNTDFSTKASARMTEWASEFYKRFEFDVVVNPPADRRTSVDRAATFLLTKTNGIRPDMRNRKEIVRDETDLIRRVKPHVEALSKSLDEIAKRRKPLLNRNAAALAALKSAIATSDFAEASIQASEIDQVAAVLKAIDAEQERIMAISGPLLKQYEDAVLRMSAKLSAADEYDYALRMQMMTKFLQGVGTGTALNVVFSRFQKFPLTTLRMRRGRTIGEALDPLPWAVMFMPYKLLVWPHAYVILNVEDYHPNTMAHEIVHAAGHDHPDDRQVKVGVEKRVKRIELGKGSYGLPSRKPIWQDVKVEYQEEEVFQEVAGGFFDGPDNNIMNYSLREEAKASEVDLSKRQRELLLNAAFVKTPPNP